VDFVFRMSRASLLARLPLYCSAECATPTNSSLFAKFPRNLANELELELIQTQMAQKPMLRAEVGMRVRCANKASAE